MSEEHPRRKKRAFGWMALSFLVFLILLITGLVFVFTETVYHLGLGWISYSARVIPEIEWNFSMIFSGLLATAIATVGFHLIAKKFSPPWKRAWTLSCVAVGGLLFLASIMTTGIVHQIAWISQENYIDPGYDFEAVHRRNAMDILYDLLQRYHGDHGQYPPRLTDLTDGYVDSEPVNQPTIWMAEIGPDEFAHWHYFPEAGELGPGDYVGLLRDSRILIASPPMDQIVIVMTTSGDVQTVLREEFEKAMSKQMRAIARLMASERASDASSKGWSE